MSEEGEMSVTRFILRVNPNWQTVLLTFVKN